MNRDRILGCLLGLAVDDTLDTAIEFQAHDSSPPVTDMVSGGVFDLAFRQRTDGTSMALYTAASLTETGVYDPRDQLARLVRWYRDGYLSSTGRCSDIDNQTRAALEESEIIGEFYRESIGGVSAGNGSLMCLAPIVMAFCDDPEAAGRFSADSSRTTHLIVECIEACGVYSKLIATTIERTSRTELYVLAVDLAEQATNPGLATVPYGPYRIKGRDKISSLGYVLHSLEVVLWALVNTDDFLEGVLLAVSLGDDADTVEVIYGQPVGVLHGRSGTPENRRDRLHGTGMIKDLAAGIADQVGTLEVVIG